MPLNLLRIISGILLIMLHTVEDWNNEMKSLEISHIKLEQNVLEVL
jgi:hypothetical protein